MDFFLFFFDNGFHSCGFLVFFLLYTGLTFHTTFVFATGLLFRFSLSRRQFSLLMHDESLCTLVGRQLGVSSKEHCWNYLIQINSRSPIHLTLRYQPLSIFDYYLYTRYGLTQSYSCSPSSPDFASISILSRDFHKLPGDCRSPTRSPTCLSLFPLAPARKLSLSSPLLLPSQLNIHIPPTPCPPLPSNVIRSCPSVSERNHWS